MLFSVLVIAMTAIVLSLIGAWFFMGGILMAWSMTSVLSILSRRAYGLEQWQTRDNYHQIGKLIFAFSVF